MILAKTSRTAELCLILPNIAKLLTHYSKFLQIGMAFLPKNVKNYSDAIMQIVNYFYDVNNFFAVDFN